MRLTEFEKEAILNVVHRVDKSAKVYLFGSRTDDEKRGGDIDLLVISESMTWRDKRKIRLNLSDRIGEQKIDILIGREGEESAIVSIAMEEGIQL